MRGYMMADARQNPLANYMVIDRVGLTTLTRSIELFANHVKP